MYHNIYPSWFVANHFGKTPFLFTYGDLSLISVDQLSAFISTPLQQHQSLYSQSPLTLDVPSMKRLSVNMLMQSMESANGYVPFLRRRNFNPTLDRQLSKESLMESACADSGISSSRSSTPSSVDTTGSIESKNTPTCSNALQSDQFRPQRKYNLGNSFQGQNVRRPVRHNPKNVQFVPKGFNGNVSNRKFPRHPKDEWFRVSHGVWDHYIQNMQKEDMYIKKMNLKDAVHSLLNQIFPNCGLRVVGSSVNGLGTNTSDVDMCLVLASPLEIDQQTEARHLLLCAQRLLSHCSFVRSTDLISAKVPILKFTEKHNNIQVDLNINNTVGIANTHLLGTYSQLDWRVSPLVLIIKKWAQSCKINNAKEMTLSSYSLVLMVIHFLQCGCDPPVLPCLQKMQPLQRRYIPGDYWNVLPYGDGFTFRSKNFQSLGSLLHGFFDYYTNKFDFSKDVISIRLGCKLPKHVAMNFRSSKNKRGHWKFVCIEEPFNRTNTACAVYDEDSFNRILSAFKTTWLQLDEKKELSSILALHA